MPKSNTVNRMAGEREGPAKETRDGENEQRGGRRGETGNRSGEWQTEGADTGEEEEEGAPSKNRTRGRFFICCH